MLREIWEKMVCDLKKCTQHEKKCSRFLFLRSFSLEYFSGKFGEIWVKILHTPKNLPAPHLWVGVGYFTSAILLHISAL